MAMDVITETPDVFWPSVNWDNLPRYSVRYTSAAGRPGRRPGRSGRRRATGGWSARPRGPSGRPGRGSARLGGPRPRAGGGSVEPRISALCRTLAGRDSVRGWGFGAAGTGGKAIVAVRVLTMWDTRPV